MSDDRQQLGRKGEQLAEHFLRKQGLRTLARRYTTPTGELDLVMRDRDTLVFVEVKTRRDRDLADPQDAVGPHKQRQMLRVAQWYMSHHRCANQPCRMDVVAVILPESGTPEITHFPSAFMP